MNSSNSTSLRRETFLDAVTCAADAAHARSLLLLLRVQDGSSTRLCEAIAAAPVALHVLQQVETADVPAVVRAALPGMRFMERITCLVAHGEVMMDNLVYVALEGLPADIRCELDGCTVPIGHMLNQRWSRRSPLSEVCELQQRLWSRVGRPDPEATRTYLITTPQGPSMIITETFRRGIRMQRPHAATPQGSSPPHVLTHQIPANLKE